MEICLSHWSALECWRNLRKSGVGVATQVLAQKSALPKKFGCISTPQQMCDVRRNYALSGDSQFLVATRGKRHEKFGSQVLAAPRNFEGVEVCEIEPGLHVVAPDVCFCQLSGCLNLVQLVALGYELCSKYSFSHYGHLAESVPLTTVSELLASPYPMARAVVARRALRYVRDNAASPKETELSMKLALHSSEGGFYRKGFSLNSEVALSEDASEIAGKKTVYPDILFPKSKTVLEYNGEREHFGDEKREADELRRLALAHDGYNVEVLEKQDLASIEEMTRIANKIALAETGRSYSTSAVGIEDCRSGLFAAVDNKVHVKRGVGGLVNSY